MRSTVRAASIVLGLAAASCSSDEEGSIGPTGIGIDLLEPEDQSYTNGTVTVRAVTYGLSPDLPVHILVNDAVVMTLDAAPYVYQWDTSGSVEGPQQIKARVTSDEVLYESRKIYVRVDRTPPVVSSRTPATGAINVPVTDPIRIDFSEPIDPATVTQESVRLTGASSAEIAKTLSIGDDGTSVTIAPIGEMALPLTARIELTGDIADLAGNRLAAESDWTFSVPAWLPIGGRVNLPTRNLVNTSAAPVAVVGSSGQLVVAAVEAVGANPADVYVYKWNGTQWSPLGTALNTLSGAASNPAIAVSTSGNPVVTWTETNGTTAQIFLQQWNGAAWVGIGSANGVLDGNATASTQADFPTLALDPATAAPIVAWQEQQAANNTASPDIFVRKWNATSSFFETPGGGVLSGVGAVASNTSAATRPFLRPAPNGTFSLIWQETAQANGNTSDGFIRRWNGTAFESPFPTQSSVGATGATNATSLVSPTLWPDTLGNPVVAWEEEATQGGLRDIYVRRWTGTAFVTMGSALQEQTGTTTATGARIVLDGSANPVVAWLEGDGSVSDIFVRRWNGTNWSASQAIVPPSDNGILSFQPYLALDSRKVPYLSFIEQDPVGGKFSVYVLRMNR